MGLIAWLEKIGHSLFLGTLIINLFTSLLQNLIPAWVIFFAFQCFRKSGSARALNFIALVCGICAVVLPILAISGTIIFVRDDLAGALGFFAVPLSIGMF